MRSSDWSPRHPDRGDPARLRRGQLARCRRARGRPRIGVRGDEWAIAAADISTGRFELIACGPGELASELARLAPAEVVAEAAVPGIKTTRRDEGFDSLAGERALKSRFGLATLDGIGSPGRAELAAAGGLLAYLDSTQKGAGTLLDAPRRVSRLAHMAIDAATRDSLELTRSIAGSVAGSLLGEIDRCQSAAGRRLLRLRHFRPADRQARDRGAPRPGRMAARGRPKRERVRSALKAMPDFAQALARLTAGRGTPRDLALLRDGLAAASALGDELAREPDRPPLLETLCLACAVTSRWSSSSPGRWSVRRRSTHRRAAISLKAMTRRSTRFATPPRTAAERSRRSKTATARRPGSPR